MCQVCAIFRLQCGSRYPYGMTLPLPEQNAKKDIAIAAGLGALGDVPGLGWLVGGIEAAIAAAAREKDEEWLAMLAARVASSERALQDVVNFSDPEFLAGAHRLFRAAQETADDEKRRRLAAAAVHSGSWSDLPLDQRERMERLVAELSSREVFALVVMSDPEGWLREHDPEALVTFRGRSTGGTLDVLDHAVREESGGKVAARSAIESLSLRGLLDIPRAGMMTGQGSLQGRATGLGRELVQYLRSIEG
jgi:hypothetical protein